MIKIYDGDIKEALLRKEEGTADVSAAVFKIIESVKKDGDKALYEFIKRFDGVLLDSLEVSKQEIEEAYLSVDKELIAALEKAAGNIRSFHEKQRRTGFISAENEGVIVGQRIIPLEKVGVYVPGGTASYPSTVLMDTIPAKIAGVGEIIMTTPPKKDGKVNPVVLAAAKIAGVDKVFKTGGAQAVAALAFGTESIPAVDKIVGPGNVFVAEAKRQVSGKVGIDMFAGPSEILIIADKDADPVHLAADMLSQAEHDKLASAILLTDSIELAKEVSVELERQIELLPRSEIARASIDNKSSIIITKDLGDAAALANEFAPEHLEICTDDPFSMLPLIKNAGSVFLGKNCPEALGDYIAGPNHTLPTSGTARFSSPLGVDDFTKRSSYIYYSKEALKNVGKDIVTMAEAEGLSAHGRSVSVRMGD
ncbi:MAG: histidinol dehydrogenase [Christensenellaceae bacterium]|nr:histidinol dehydrogenase [Christensenellaceae bacterium]